LSEPWLESVSEIKSSSASKRQSPVPKSSEQHTSKHHTLNASPGSPCLLCCCPHHLHSSPGSCCLHSGTIRFMLPPLAPTASESWAPAPEGVPERDTPHLVPISKAVKGSHWGTLLRPFLSLKGSQFQFLFLFLLLRLRGVRRACLSLSWSQTSQGFCCA